MMGGLISQATKIGLVAVAALASCTPAVAATDGPKFILKDMSLVVYQSIIDPDGNVVCKVNQDHLQTSLQFVANQSQKLKLISDKQRDLAFEAAKLKQQGMTTFSPEWKTAQKETLSYIFPPMLWITVSIIELGNACVASIDAKLELTTEPAKMMNTDKVVPRPFTVVWSKGYWLTGSKTDFVQRVTGEGTNILMKFVNDWTESQND